jgi:nucleoside-diphosphate-sugar epimerase
VSTAFILGGSGQIGRAAAHRLLEAGWDVTIAGRDPSRLPPALVGEVRFARIDRSEDLLEPALGSGVDVLVDCVAYTQRDAEQLVAAAPLAGSLVVVSSASVYTDASGRTFDEADQPDRAPVFPVPIPESQPTVPPGDGTYSTRKAALEATLFEAELAVTVIRPAAIYGPGSAFPRELHFVKRVLDRRRAVVLAGRGATLFHTTSAVNLAELIRVVAANPGKRALNCGDPGPPTALEISRAIAAALGYAWAEVLLPPPIASGGPGDHPWCAPHQLVLDMAAAAALGYTPVVAYEQAVPEVCAWLASALRDQDWREAFPRAGELMASSFDYEAEDALLASLGNEPG